MGQKRNNISTPSRARHFPTVIGNPLGQPEPQGTGDCDRFGILKILEATVIIPESSILNARGSRPGHEVNTHVFHRAHPLIASRFNESCWILTRTGYRAVRRVGPAVFAFRFTQPLEQQGKSGMSLSHRMSRGHITFKNGACSRNKTFALNLTALKIRPLSTFFGARRAGKARGSARGRLTTHE